MSENAFVPFNLSSVVPFDTLSAALNSIPTLHLRDPSTTAYEGAPAVPSASLTEQLRNDLSRLVVSTVHDE